MFFLTSLDYYNVSQIGWILIKSMTSTLTYHLGMHRVSQKFKFFKKKLIFLCVLDHFNALISKIIFKK